MKFIVFFIMVVTAMLSLFMLVSVFTAHSFLPLVPAFVFGFVSRWADRLIRDS